MRSIQLYSFFKVTSPAQGVYDMYLDTYGGQHDSNRSRMSLEDFFTHLPVQELNQFVASQMFNGYADQYERKLHYATMIDQDVQPIDLFRGMEYKHYDSLESDIRRINPSYTLERDPKSTLKNYLEYYQKETQTWTMRDVSARFGTKGHPLPINELKDKFVCINQKTGTYILPYTQSEKKETLSYLFKTRDKQMLVYVKDEEICTVGIQKGRIQTSMFHRTDIEGMVACMDAYFPDMENDRGEYHHPPHTISVRPLDEGKTTIKVETTAKLAAAELHCTRAMSSLRTCFSERYQVKARGEKELWDRVFPHLEKTLPTIHHPLFEGMGSGKRTTEEIVEEMYPDITRAVKGTQAEKMDLAIKLRLMSRMGIIDGTLNVEEAMENPKLLEDTHTNKEVYFMPDYGEIADQSPDITTLLR